MFINLVSLNASWEYSEEFNAPRILIPEEYKLVLPSYLLFDLFSSPTHTVGTKYNVQCIKCISLDTPIDLKTAFAASKASDIRYSAVRFYKGKPLLFHSSEREVRNPSYIGSNRGELGVSFYCTHDIRCAMNMWLFQCNPRTGRTQKYVNIYAYDSLFEIHGGGVFITRNGGQVFFNTKEAISLLSFIDFISKSEFVEWIRDNTISIDEYLVDCSVAEVSLLEVLS